jgi:hypothetical protein
MTLTHLQELLAISEAKGKTAYVAVPASERGDKALAPGRLPACAYFTADGYGIDWDTNEDYRTDDGPGPVAVGQVTVPDAKILRDRDEIVRIAREAGVDLEESPYFYSKDVAAAGGQSGGHEELDLVYVPAFMKALRAAGYETIGGDRTITNGSDECVMIVDPSQFRVTGYQDGPEDD